jgi:MYXO-CTERM domain-containing protein
MNPGGEFDLDVTLPDTPCDPCVLQMIQVMTTSGGAFNGNYYQCADIVIEGAAATGGETMGEGSTGDATTGDSGGTSGGTTTTTGRSDASTSGDGGTDGDTDSSGDALPASSSGDEGCSVGSQRSPTPGWLLLGVLGLLGLRSRRRARLPR